MASQSGDELNKRFFNPFVDSSLSVVKKRRLQKGTEHILPSPGLLGPPRVESVPWPMALRTMDESDALREEARMAELERQQRINRATYETPQIGPIREIVGK